MITLILDADSAGYQYAFRNTKTFDFGDTGSAMIEDEAAAKDGLKSYIEELRSDLGADQVVLALSDYERPVFRKAIFPEYKKSRGEKPKLLYVLRQWMQENYTTYIRPMLEADDVVGILGTHPSLIEGERIIVSIDKDLRGIPGKLYNPNKGTLEEIDEAAADYFFYTQVLTGDQVDEYPGLPGVGPKKAEAILKGAVSETYWPRIVAAYKKNGLTAKDALVQARVARILRYTDYDFKKKKPKLWNPPKVTTRKAA